MNRIRNYALKLKHRGNNHRFTQVRFPTEVIFYQHKKIKKNKPLNFSFDRKTDNFIVIDGQIYNLKEINKKYLEINEKRNLRRNNHLEGVIEGYKKCGIKVLNQLLGSFSGVIFNGKELVSFKDPIGVKPLYYCENKDFFIVSSELKALAPLNLNISPIKPGRARFSSGYTMKYYNYPQFINEDKITRRAIINYANNLNKLVKLVVADNIRDGERISTFLSGGLDSAIVTYVAKNLVEELKVYTVGMKESKDMFYAKKFTKLYNLNHTSLEIELNDMLGCLSDVIYALETFDAALIRNSVPMFLLSKRVKKDQGKSVLLTGEGGDELFGGYTYLANLDSKKSLNQELLNLLEIEYKTRLQRLDHIPYYFSIEARAPLYDQRILEMSFNIPPKLKIYKKKNIGIAKKWILRKAFENEIPAEFIWRKKLKFSNGTGSQFILRDYINNIISEKEFNDEKQILPEFSVRSKEELYYWRIFESHFKPTLGTISELGITNEFEL